MIYITSDPSFIRTTLELDKFTILKNKSAGAKHRLKKTSIMSIAGKHLIDIDYSKGVTVDGVLQTSLTMWQATIEQLLISGALQNFIATPTQVAFATVVPANTTTNTRVYVNGIRTIGTWSIIAGVVTFALGMAGGELVMIEVIQ